jgi:cytochrome c oxidase cbb3-type subunit 4
MDAGLIRGIGTLTLLLSFVALCCWAWLPKQRGRFDEAAQLPWLGEHDGSRAAKHAAPAAKHGAQGAKP